MHNPVFLWRMNSKEDIILRYEAFIIFSLLRTPAHFRVYNG